jgi:hypothetical protein
MPRAKLNAPDANGDRMLLFECPGCGTLHGPRVVGPRPGALWGWNGDLERPTLTPSILVRYYQMSEEGRAMLERNERPADGRYPGHDVVCHSFVTDGRIAFLRDCTHALAGQTVDLPEFEG